MEADPVNNPHPYDQICYNRSNRRADSNTRLLAKTQLLLALSKFVSAAALGDPARYKLLQLKAGPEIQWQHLIEKASLLTVQ